MLISTKTDKEIYTYQAKAWSITIYDQGQK